MADTGLTTIGAAPPFTGRGWIAVVGVTASGKSALALTLAERFAGEIVSTDSMQVYRYLDIGTAKPGWAERQRIPHHLIDLIDPDESYSAGRFVADARRIIADIVARGRVPILCGGTGLYFKALLRGLSPVPAIPVTVRREVAESVERYGLAACHAELRRIDPEHAARVHVNDGARILRALEVHRATGLPLSAFQREAPFGTPPETVLAVGLRWERPALYARIARRVAEMLATGWIEEVARVLAMGYVPELKPLRSIGYREIGEHLAGLRDRESLAPAIITRTRRYAKRQWTWLRHQTVPGGDTTIWAPPGEEGALFRRVERFLRDGANPD